MNTPIVSPQEWEAAREQLLVKERSRLEPVTSWPPSGDGARSSGKTPRRATRRPSRMTGGSGTTITPRTLTAQGSRWSTREETDERS